MHRVFRAGLALVFAGCYSPQNPSVGDGGHGGSDGSLEPDADNSGCPGSVVKHCFDPTTSFTISGDIDTSPSGPMCVSSAGAVCIIAAGDVTFSSGLSQVRVTGSRPLAIFTHDDFLVPGDVTLDASSHQGDPVTDVRLGGGHGTNQGCDEPPPQSSPIGGAGGSWGSLGGAGGGLGPGAFRSAPNPTTPELIGGCPGLAGGPAGGAPTPPGGAIYLFSEGEVHVIGTVTAGGAGGRGGGGGAPHGGDGGGAGGTLILEGKTDIFVEGQLYAVGGSGGGGGDTSSSGHVGEDGFDGNGTGGTPAPLGGTGGQPGSPDGEPGISGGASFGGGGGGLGGDGVIYLIGPNSLGTVIPPPIMLPST